MFKRRNLLIGGVAIAALIIALGVLIYDDLFGLGGPLSSGDTVAPELVAAEAQEIVYRIDPAQSEVRYYVDEVFVGEPVSTAVGTTTSVAGDVLINSADFASSEVGTIVINVEHFESDSGLRDGRIRQDYLESSTYPEATFVPVELIDFPEDVTTGEPYTFQMRGDLTVKETTSEATWDVTATLDGDTLIGQASTIILMSTYDVGPISIAGFVETSDEVRLEFDFVAVSTEASNAVVAETVAISDEVEIVQPVRENVSEASQITTDLMRMSTDAQAITTPDTPQVRLDVAADPVLGLNVRVEALNFVLSPEQAGNANVAGEGHAYLFVDGQIYSRVYSEWLHLENLPVGERQLTVALANNDGSLLKADDTIILDETMITVAQ